MAVIIGMDPHKWSATIEVINDLGEVIVAGKFAPINVVMRKCW